MRSVITWVARNGPTINTMMLAILLTGVWSATQLYSESFPEFQLDQVKITVPYPGASPSEVEEGICQKIEEAIRAVEGIKKISAVAQEGSGTVVAELKASVSDPQRVLNDLRSEVDRIPSFPLEAEDPEVQLVVARSPTIRVALFGGQVLPKQLNQIEQRQWRLRQQLQLREVAERVREELLDLDSISSVDIVAEKKYQIDVELSEDALRKYGLTLQEVGQILRRENIELPAGTIKTAASEYLVRGKNKRSIGQEIDELPLLTRPDGAVLRVRDLGQSVDGFEENDAGTFVAVPDEQTGVISPGMPAITLVVQKTSSEDLLQITSDVRDYVTNKSKQLPPGYQLIFYDDQSIIVQERLDTLVQNGLMGLVLVFIVLSLFLEFRLAFWVSLGIPISIAGGLLVLLSQDQTLNMVSTFAFLLVLGIVVDDAIVVGENVYRHREMGKSLMQASIDGTCEVAAPVISSVLTTTFAFMPMLYVSGTLGKVMVVMPIVVISVLAFSLAESLFILPNHLADGSSDVAVPLRRRTLIGQLNPLRGLWRLARYLLGPTVAALGMVLYRVQAAVTQGLHDFIEGVYQPLLRRCIHYPAIAVAASLALLIMTFGLVVGGFTPFVFFPKLDAPFIKASVKFPNGTPIYETEQAVAKMVKALERIQKQQQRQYGESPIKLVVWTTGYSEGEGRGPQASQDRTSASHVGQVSVELIGSELRTDTSDDISAKWRREVVEALGGIAGVEELKFGTAAGGPGGKPIEFQIVGSDMRQLEAAVEVAKEQLQTYEGVFDVADNSLPGKPELQVRVKPNAEAIGIDSNQVAQTLRASFYGEEVMRLQRGRHEVKLMVRYPPEERESLENLENIRIRSAEVGEIPIEEVALVDVERGYSEINRVDQKRQITVTADLDEATTNAQQIVNGLKASFVPRLLEQFPSIQVRWEGQEKQRQESLQSLFLGFVVALFAMYVLLTTQFGSYIQPFFVLTAIPFGFIGAIVGHFIMGLPLTLFSMFGMVALAGVVVNDSIVLIDFINQRRASGAPLEAALSQAGRERFRPVLLTSLTTIAALVPIMLESSLQVQILIPMATSLAFGLISSTMFVLLLVPSIYALYAGPIDAE